MALKWHWVPDPLTHHKMYLASVVAASIEGAQVGTGCDARCRDILAGTIEYCCSVDGRGHAAHQNMKVFVWHGDGYKFQNPGKA